MYSIHNHRICFMSIEILMFFFLSFFHFTDYPSIPLSEAYKYIKSFKLNIPWYDIEGISIWCMDHSCYDCRCLTDPTFHDSPKEDLTEKSATSLKSLFNPKAPLSAVDTFEEVLKGLSTRMDEVEEDPYPHIEPACTVVNIIVNNKAAKRNYSWKLKEWSHSLIRHCARTAGYSKDRLSEETKHMEISGLAARAATPEQMVETVVRTLRNTREKLQMPTLQPGGYFKPFMDDSLAKLQSALGLAQDNIEPKAHTTSHQSVPLIDLSSGNVEEKKVSEQGKFGTTAKSILKPFGDGKLPQKRKLSGSSDIPHGLGNDVAPVAKKPRQSGAQDEVQLLYNSSDVSQYPCVDSGFSLKMKSYTTNDKLYSIVDSEQKKPVKKALSLLEMMMAEENRGELELDLADNFPGNAILVAEGRFRKLINMNIIGVIGINKAGR